MIKRLIKKIKGNNKKNPINFQDFTPKDDLELNENLKEAFDFAFNNKKINNIGLLGKYAAGKSSLINSYLKTRKDIKFIKISFAHFKDCETKDNTSKDKEKDNKDEPKPIDSLALERKIINQLLNLIDSNKIKLTSFYVKRDFKSKIFISESMALGICILGWIYLLGSIKKLDLLIKGKLFVYTIPVITLGLTIWFIYKFRIYILNGHKIKFNTLELELNKDNQKLESYFDLYLSEIVYLIENSKCDVILFEDMDRFEIKSIFERLHEVNGIVNQRLNQRLNKRLKKKRKSIKFVYLVKENIFTNEDRAKFFDFIIPTTNVINKSNSFDELLKMIKKNNADKNFNFEYEFLKKVCEYITDIRVLKNIYNEFLIYYAQVSTYYDKETKQYKKNEINANKIFSIVLYKTFCPKDFNDLQENKGILYNLLFKVDSKIINEMLSPYKNYLETIYKEKVDELKKLDLFDKEFNIDEYIDYYILSNYYKLYNEYEFDIYLDIISKIDINEIILGYTYISNKKFIISNEITHSKYSVIGAIYHKKVIEAVIIKKIIKYIEFSIDMQVKNLGYFSYDILCKTLHKINDNIKSEKTTVNKNKSNKKMINNIKKINEVEFLSNLIENVLKSTNTDYLNTEFIKNKELFIEFLKSGYFDDLILDYTRSLNKYSNSSEKYFIHKVKYKENINEDKSYIEDKNKFHSKIDAKYVAIQIESIYWFDNLNILNFYLLDYLLYKNNTSKDNLFIKLHAFISNLTVSTSVLENKNETKLLFIFKYFLHVNENHKKDKFFEILKQKDVKIYKLDFNHEDIKQTTMEEKREFLEYIVKNNLYIINNFNLKVIGKILFKNNKDYFNKNFSYIKQNCTEMFLYIKSDIKNIFYYLNYCYMMHKQIYDESTDVIELIKCFITLFISNLKQYETIGTKTTNSMYHMGYENYLQNELNNKFKEDEIPELNIFNTNIIFEYLWKLHKQIESVDELLICFRYILYENRDKIDDYNIKSKLFSIYEYLVRWCKFKYTENNIFSIFLNLENTEGLENIKKIHDYIIEFINIYKNHKLDFSNIISKYIFQILVKINKDLFKNKKIYSDISIVYEIKNIKFNNEKNRFDINRNNKYKCAGCTNTNIQENITFGTLDYEGGFKQYIISDFMYVDPIEFKDYDFDNVRYIINYNDENNLEIYIELYKKDEKIKRLDFYNYTPFYFKNKIKEFLKFIITSNEINNESYEEILSTIGFKDDINKIIRDNINIINKDKLDVLRKIGMETEFAQV